MRPVHLHVPVGPGNQQTGPMQIAGEVDQQVQAAAVGVVQVFQYQEQRLHLGSDSQEPAYRLQQAPALLVWVSRLAR